MADDDQLPPRLSARDEELRTLAATIAPDDDAELETYAPPPEATVAPPEEVGATVSPPEEVGATVGPDDAQRSLGSRMTAGGSKGSVSGGAVPAPSIVEPGGQNPRYPLVKMIGEGGMGQIFLARQESLSRDVAVKTIRPQWATNKLLDASFRSEAMVTGDLEHPNIVPVHEMGRTPDGRAYMAMKLVKGFEWADLIHPGDHPERAARAAQMGLRDHLDILVKICDAVAFAHSRNILHRDLKPRNVMVGEFGEVLVMDWGLALDIGDAPPPEPKALHKSAVKAAAGTPAYMPPELAIPDPARLGPPTDVYLLGAILYELLTGTPPHQGKNTGELLDRAKKGVVEAPELRAPGRHIPAELSRIALHALAPDPAARPQTAGAFRQELRDFLSHEESVRLAEDADRQLAQLEQAGAVAREDRYARYADALSRIGEALHLWPENPVALRSRGRAALAYADEALDRGDIGLAAAQMPVLDASPLLDPGRTAAVRAALSAHATASRRRKFAFAIGLFLAFACYFTLGDRWSALAAEDRAMAASERLTKALAEAWDAVRENDLAKLAVAEQALAESQVAALPEHKLTRPDVAFARGVLLWRRQRWEELLELATTGGYLPAGVAAKLAGLGQDAVAGRPYATLTANLKPFEGSKSTDRSTDWIRLARLAVLGIASRHDRSAAAPAFRLATSAPSAGAGALDVVHDHEKHQWIARDRATGAERWRYQNRRGYDPVWPALADDAGGYLLLTQGQVVRLDGETGRVTARATLRFHPVLAWPDLADARQLVVLVEDDATSGGGLRAGDGAYGGGSLDLTGGGVFAAAGTRPGSGRVRETRVTLDRVQVDAAGDAALAAAFAAMPAPGPKPAVESSDAKARRDALIACRALMPSVLQDPSDAHLAAIVLTKHGPALPPPARAALVSRLDRSAGLLVPEEELVAAYRLEHAGALAAANRHFANAARRFLMDDGNPELGESSWGGAISRELVERAATPQRAQELLEVSLSFAAHRPGDLELERTIGEKLQPPPQQGAPPPKIDYDHPELHGPATGPAFVLDFWDMVAKRLALFAAIASLYLAFALARKSAATRRADLHAIGMRTTGERAVGFFTRPFDRLRHVSLAYATRFERLVMAGVGVTFVIALGASAAARRMDADLRLMLMHPAVNIGGGADLIRVFEARRATGTSPAVLRLLADQYRARRDYRAAKAALAELDQRLPGYDRTTLDRGVLEEETGGDPTPYYEAAAKGEGEPAAAARWNLARRRGDAAARGLAEAGLSPSARRTARALDGMAPLWLPARLSDLQATAFDGGTIRHHMVAGIFSMRFDPGQLTEKIRDELDLGEGSWIALAIAVVLSGFFIGALQVIVLMSVLALIWLPLPVRTLLEPRPATGAPGLKRRAIDWFRRLGRGMFVDLISEGISVLDVFLPGLHDLKEGRAAAGILKLMIVIGGTQVAAVADETIKFAGSALLAAIAGREPPLIALIGELDRYLVWAVYLTNLPIALARFHRLGYFKMFQNVAEHALMPAHLARIMVAALHARRPLHEAVRAYAADYALVRREKRDADRLAADLESGAELPEALARFPLFPAWAARAVAWGRTAGRVPEALEAVAEMLSRERRMDRKLRRVLLIPVFQAGIVAWFGAFLMKMLAPQLQEIAFSLATAERPGSGLLRLITGAAEYATTFQVASFALFVIFAYGCAGAGGPLRALFERAAAWVLPARRRALADMRHAMAARLLAFALESRVPLHEALGAVAAAVPAAPLAPRLAAAATRVEHGEPPAQVLAPHGERDGAELFELASALTGEGGADRLRGLSARLHARADSEIERLPAVVVPLMTVLTGLFVLVFMATVVGVLSEIAELSARVLLR